MPAFRKHKIVSSTTVFDEFFKINKLLVSHEKADAAWSGEQKRLVFERGDAAAVLLYNSDRHRVVLTRQFRPASLHKGLGKCRWPGDGWVLETVAGMIPDNEYPEKTAVRETREETGYEIDERKLRPIAEFFASPGGSSERIFLYYAEVRDADRRSTGGGVDDDEDVEVIEIAPDELFEMMNFESKQKEGGTIEDSKLMVAALWLQDELQKLDRAELPPGDPVGYRMRHDPELVVGYLTGHIADVRGIDIWVNSENEDMIMDRFIGRSISANIRYFGADKDRRKNVREDTIANALKRALGGHLSVKVGTVIETRPGALEAFGVRRVYHVASVRGMGAGRGVVAALHDLKRCTSNVLFEAEERNRHWWRSYAGKDRSIVFPLIGAGDGGLPAQKVAPELIGAAVEFLHSTPPPSLKEIYFLAFNGQQRRACVQALEDLCQKGELLPPACAAAKVEAGGPAESTASETPVTHGAVP